MNVYLIHAEGTTRYKIGITSRTIESRMKELNSSQAAYPLKLITNIKNNDFKAIERHLHEKYKHNRVYGEWFQLNQNELIEVQNYMQTFNQPLSSFKPILKQKNESIVRYRPQQKKLSLSIPFKNWLLPLTIGLGFIYACQHIEFFQTRTQTHNILKNK